MATKNDDLTTVLIAEVERNLEQMTDLSLAFTRAATRAWTRGLQATVDALSAATDDSAAPKGGDDPARGRIQRLGRGVRDFTHTASIGYGDALRQGATQYIAAVEEVLGKRRTANTAPANAPASTKPVRRRPARAAKA